jgi:SWI/SNF-related matrix-associated actin-dependent regulator 1 of chromatin subfamily A
MLEKQKLEENIYNYQKEGISFMINANGRVLLADAPGLGKSLQAIGYVLHTKQKKTLIICPANVKYSWVNEITKWSGLSYRMLNSKDEITIDLLNEYDIFLINYDILNVFFDCKKEKVLSSTGKYKIKKTFIPKSILNIFKFDCIIYDEIQYCKSLRSDRGRLSRMLSQISDNVLCLTGTPIINRVSELFPILNIINRKEWNNYFLFTKRYCDGHYGRWGWECDGASNIPELKKRIDKYYLRRTKEDIEIQLPPKIRIDVPVELEKKERIKYELAVEDLKKFLIEIKERTDEETARAMQAETLVRLNALRQITSNGKIESAKELITNLIESGEKVIVFSVYNNPLENLYEEFKKCSVILTGKSSEQNRRDAVDKFQNDKNTMVFFGGTRSAGVGITLHTSPNILFLDFDWTPSAMQQAEDRAHRMGMKTEHLTIYQLFAINSIDEKMKSILEEKKEIFNNLVEKDFDFEQQSLNVINNIIKSFQI